MAKHASARLSGGWSEFGGVASKRWRRQRSRIRHLLSSPPRSNGSRARSNSSRTSSRMLMWYVSDFSSSLRFSAYESRISGPPLLISSPGPSLLSQLSLVSPCPVFPNHLTSSLTSIAGYDSAGSRWGVRPQRTEPIGYDASLWSRSTTAPSYGRRAKRPTQPDSHLRPASMLKRH
jgi:hypothetical protein